MDRVLAIITDAIQGLTLPLTLLLFTPPLNLVLLTLPLTPMNAVIGGADAYVCLLDPGAQKATCVAASVGSQMGGRSVHEGVSFRVFEEKVILSI